MSKKGTGIKVDDLLESLQDERVILLLTKTFRPIMEGLFNELIEAFSAKLDNMVAKSAEALLSTHCEEINSKVTALEVENELLKARVDEYDNLSRLDNLVICGLPEIASAVPQAGSYWSTQRSSPPNESDIHNVVDLCNNKLGVKLSESDISYAYRIPGSSKNNQRPVVVRFVSRRIRNSILAARRTLKEQSGANRIFINEHLTKQNSLIFARARRLVREKVLHSAWTRDGMTFIRLTDSVSEKPSKIVSSKNLESIVEKKELTVLLPQEKTG